MEHIKNFANLTKTFSANFPEFEELAPLYILAFAIIEFDTSFLFFENISEFGFIVNPKVLQDIGKYNSIDIKKISKAEFKEVCNYLVEECLNTAKLYSNSSINLQGFLSNLATREPQAAWKR